MNTHLLMVATANHSRHVGARLLANVQVDPDTLTDSAIQHTIAIGNEFRLASSLASDYSARQTQLLERCRVCLDLLADVEEALMLAAGERP